MGTARNSVHYRLILPGRPEITWHRAAVPQHSLPVRNGGTEDCREEAGNRLKLGDHNQGRRPVARDRPRFPPYPAVRILGE
jgi:hypothetical protein